MNNSRSESLFQSSNSPISTIRPRNRRLISFNDENEDEGAIASASAARPNAQEPSKFPARSLSPIANPHPSKRLAQSTENTVNTSNVCIKQPAGPGGWSNGLASPAGLWESWSSLHGLASGLLGSDTKSPNRSGTNGSLKSPGWRKTSKPLAAPRSVPQWGPTIDAVPQLAAGTQEERQAMVQAKRRETLLLARAHEGADSTGRYKRRDSDTNLASSIPPEDQEDALVYVHRVKPGDTLAGVMIRYSCQPDVFRKVNRFWPNDEIQIRTHVLLPLEACGVRGRKVGEFQEAFDLLGSDPGPASPLENSTSFSHPSPFDTTGSSDPLSLSLSLTKSHDSTLFKHESWVRIPNFLDPVEILRIPRRTLGFFPPARRKSSTSSSIDNRVDPYSDSPPKISFDMLRHPPTHSASLNASPSRLALHSRPHRSSSIATTTPAITFSDRLKGPGGVGTLRGLGTGIATPGPAEDSLNKLFAHHLPNVAPPRLTPRPTPRGTPRGAIDSIHSNSSTGLGEVGGAIEGWVRKLGRAGGKSDRIAERMGDLIELEGTGAGDAGDGDGEGDLTPTIGINANDEALLTERFPPRGRIREAYPGRPKAD